MMAHMDRISMGDMYGVHAIRLQARARAPESRPRFSCFLLGRHRDAMRQWLKKRLSELLYARARLKCLCLSISKHT